MRTKRTASENATGRYARISLVLILTLLLNIFMYEGWYKPKFVEAAPTSDGRFVYSIATTTPQNRVYSVATNTFGAQTATLTGATNQTFFVNRKSKTRNENIVGYVTTGGVLYIYRWNGSTWINETSAAGGWGGTVTVGGNGVDGRRFDIVYENTRGNAVVVYSTGATGSSGSAEMAYRVWNGSTWTGATNVVANSTGFNQNAQVTWIKLAAKPTSGSNEVALLAADTGTTTANTSILTSFIWNGTSWSEAAQTHTASAAATLPNTTGQLMQNDCFDQAYESLSGDLLVVFTTASTAQQWRREYSGGAWVAAVSYATGRAVPLQMIAASDPQSDQILVMWSRQEAAPARVYGNIWSGSAVGTSTTLAGGTANGIQPAINKKTIAGRWLISGGTSYAVALWVTNTAGTIGYNYFTTAWQATGLTYVSGTGTAAQWMDTDKDPQSADTMMLTFSDSASDLWAKRLVLTAGPTFTWSNADGGAALTATLGSITSQNFSFAYDYAPPTTLTIGDGTTTGATVYRNDQRRTLDQFSMLATGGTVTVSQIVVTGTNTANVGPGCVYLYQDNGTTPNAWDASDTIVASSTFASGPTATFSTLSIGLASGATNTYLVVVDIDPAAVNGQTITGFISSVASSAGTTVNNDNADGTLTVGSQTLTVGDGTASQPTSTNAQQGSVNNAVAEFELSTSNGTNYVSQIVVTGSTSAGTLAGNVSAVVLWQDSGSIAHQWDAGDIQLGTDGVFSGVTATFTALNQAVTTTPVRYLIVYDIAAGATIGAQLQGRVSGISSDANTPVNNDTVDATLTVTGGTCNRQEPSVQITPSTGQAAPNDSVGYTVSVTNNDSSFCASSTFTVTLTNTPAVPNGHFLSAVLGSSSTGALAPAGNWQTTLTLTTRTTATPGTTQQSFVTTSDANHASVQSNTVVTQVVAGWANSTLLHNSINLMSSAWSGSWGVPNGKYGAFMCTTCHDRKTGNIKRIKQAIVSESTDTWPNGSTTTGPISFTSATAGSSNFGKTGAPFNGVCNVCHSPTYHTNYSYNSSNGHEASTDCTTCHKHKTAFSGDGPCMSCHDSQQLGTYNTRTVVGTTGDFVRASHHVNDGTTTQIVTDYDCVICHAEGDAVKVNAGSGWLDKAKHKNGTTSSGSTTSDRMVKLRNVDLYTSSWDYSKNVLTKSTNTVAKTQMRDNMDSFCMGCHDSNGASQIAVANGPTPTQVIIGANASVFTRTSSTGLSRGKTLNLWPFNSNDLLNGNNTDSATIKAFKTSTLGRVLNVKDQFNSTNATGRNWASHHNLNQFTKRYTTRNTTYWPAAILTSYVTKQSVTLNGTVLGSGETAGLHCSDCHLNETNAHGVAARFMLDDGTVNQTESATATWTGTAASATMPCYKCHAQATYNAGTTGRFTHTEDSQRTLTTITSPLGIICFNCHGGYSTRPEAALGAIHGTNETYFPAEAAVVSKRYRFMSGSTMRFYKPTLDGTTYTDPTDWESAARTGACYTVSADDTWSTGCSSHGGGVGSGEPLDNTMLLIQKPLQW